MRLLAHISDMSTSEPIVMLNGDDCLRMGVGPQDRVRITCKGTIVSKVLISDASVRSGEILMPEAIMERCCVDDGDEVDVVYSPMPESVKSIKAKINGERLSHDEIDSIVSDMFHHNLSAKEIIAFVSSFNINNTDIDEIASLTRSMASTGKMMDLGEGPLYDFHSLGGIPGNKITPIVVSIVASEGIRIPKMSSRAVSSACGTSDYVDTFCDVEMDSDRLPDALSETNGLFVCGNNEFAPVGSVIIDAERPMGIDPRPMMMASIMSKKVALGVTHLLIDIPMGKDTKVKDLSTARDYERDFKALGRRLGIKVECAVTTADQPLGRAIGPILEARECISILENGDGDDSVVSKACGMAGMILEMAGIGNGLERASDILRSGRAHTKFLEIVKAQNGDPQLRSSDLVPGRFFKDVHAKRDGYIRYIDNECMVAIAKGAGAPNDIGAGIEIFHKVGDHVSEGEALFRIYAENESKLERSVLSARSRRPMEVVRDEVHHSEFRIY